jgi:hypothetical protein
MHQRDYFFVQADDSYYLCHGQRIVDGPYTQVVRTASGVMMLFPDPDMFECMPTEMFTLSAPPQEVDIACIASVLDDYQHVQYYALV